MNDDWKFCDECWRELKAHWSRQGIEVSRHGDLLIKSPRRAIRRCKTERKLNRRIAQLKYIFHNDGGCYQWRGYKIPFTEECDPYFWSRPFSKYRDRHVINWKGGRYGAEPDPGHNRTRDGWKWNGDLEEFGDTQRGREMRNEPPYSAKED